MLGKGHEGKFMLQWSAWLLGLPAMMLGHRVSGAGRQAVAGCMLGDLTYLHPPPFLSVQKACAHLPGLQTRFTGQSGTWPGKADVNLITLFRMCLPV